MKVIFFRRGSISVLTLLLACCPEDVVCKNSTSYSVIDWFENGKVPSYYVVGLGGLLLVTIMGCILCLWCTRRRRAKDIRNDAIEGSTDDKSWEMIPSSAKETKKDSQEQEKEKVTIIKISVQNTDNKKEVEKKSNEETTNLEEEESRDHKTQPDAACEGDESRDEANESGRKPEENVTDTPLENSIDGTNDMKHDESESADGICNSDKPRAEPLYAEVNKAKKKKVKSGYSIVYAELADFDKNRSDSSLPKQNSAVEYAEIARLTKSPRDMCPLDD